MAINIKSKAPVILTGLGIIGLGFTIYSAIKDTIRAEETSEEIIEVDAETGEEIVPPMPVKCKYLLHAYSRTIAWGLMTTSCFIASMALEKRNERKLLAASVMATQITQKIQEEIKNTLTADEEPTKLNTKRAQEVFDGYTTDIWHDETYPDGDCIFYESLTEQFFKTSWAKVIDALYKFNRNFTLGGERSVAELFEFLNIPYDKKKWEEYGWNVSDFYEDGFELAWVDMYTSTKLLDDGTSYNYMYFVVDPYKYYYLDADERKEAEHPRDE